MDIEINQTKTELPFELVQLISAFKAVVSCSASYDHSEVEDTINEMKLALESWEVWCHDTVNCPSNSVCHQGHICQRRKVLSVLVYYTL